MIHNQIYMIILIVSAMILISKLSSIAAGYLLSDIVLALYVSYLIKTFFIRTVYTKEFWGYSKMSCGRSLYTHSLYRKTNLFARRSGGIYLIIINIIISDAIVFIE